MGASFNLSTVAGGALQRKVDQAFTQIIENMCDPNTPPNKKENSMSRFNLYRTAMEGSAIVK